MPQTKSEGPVTASKGAHKAPASGLISSTSIPAIVLILLLTGFITLQCLLPLRTAIQIGGDEGFELAKATLCLNGYHLYTDVWNDQPPLHTFLITAVLKHISPSILGPRLVTIFTALVLLASVFLICLRLHGLVVAGLTTALLIASPGFLELSASCMLEIPALAPAIAALCLLLICNEKKWTRATIFSGCLFGIALEIKLIPLILLPLVALIIWTHYRNPSSTLRSLLLFATCLAVSFTAIDYLVDRGDFLLHIRQSWISHFGSAKSFEYGSANDHPFDWIVLLRNADTTLPAIVGLIFLFRQRLYSSKSFLPVVWLGLMLIIFVVHRPWWPYYYIHLAIPLCWCAALGIEAARRVFSSTKSMALRVLLIFYVNWAPVWMGARVYLQVEEVRNSPQIYSALVLSEVARFKPFTQWMYAEQPIYSFHAGIPLPPDLGVVMLKRLWSGEMTNAKMNSELATLMPGVFLLVNDTRVLPFSDLLNSDYRLVYQDADSRLYARKDLVMKARR